MTREQPIRTMSKTERTKLGSLRMASDWSIASDWIQDSTIKHHGLGNGNSCFVIFYALGF